MKIFFLLIFQIWAIAIFAQTRAQDLADQAELAQSSPKKISLYNKAILACQQHEQELKSSCYLLRAAERLKLKDFKPAIQDYDSAIALNNKYVEAYCNRAIAKAQEREYNEQEIIEDFKKAIYYKKDFAEAYFNLARYKISKGNNDWQQLLNELNKAIENKNNYAIAYHTRGYVHLKLGNKENAKKDYETALKHRVNCETGLCLEYSNEIYGEKQDNTPPIITFSPIDKKRIEEGEIMIIVSIKDESKIRKVYFNGKETPLSSTNMFEKPVTLSPGNNAFLVRAIDIFGNETERTLNVQKKSKPTITFYQPNQPTIIVANSAYKISYCIESADLPLKNHKLLLNGNDITNIYRGQQTRDICKNFFDTEVTLQEGSNEIIIEVSNEVGSIKEIRKVNYFSQHSNKRRLALFIGNENYQNCTKLPNAVKDAKALAEKLKTLGFDIFYVKENLSKEEMMKVLREFSEKLKDYEVGLFFYAGHGVEVDGQTYMLPINIPAISTIAKFDVTERCLSIEYLQNAMKEGKKNGETEEIKKTYIVILDACREDPFATTTWRNPSGNSNVENKWGTTATQKTPPGFYIIYATLSGELASDDASLTKFMLKRIDECKIIQSFMISVKNDIEAYYKNKKQQPQKPEVKEDLKQDFYFKNEGCK